MERIRDFLYDVSDLLISLLIIAVIFAVISWKLNESIPIDIATAPPGTEEPAAPVTPDSEDPATDTDVGDASDADKPIEGTPVTITPVIPETPSAETPPQTPAAPPAAGQSVVVEIPSGSPGVAIARILKEKGLITDINGFIQQVDAMGLGPKLQSGKYTLKTGMGLEEIIKILANVD